MSASSPTANILSSWLRRSGSLLCGSIVDVRIELEIETTISKLVFLTATYSPDAPANLPRHLVVKSPLNAPVILDDSRGEAQFYRQLAPALGAPPAVRCLAACAHDNGDSGTVVLEDLRATHDHPPWPLPPSRKQSESALDALARVHAQWW